MVEIYCSLTEGFEYLILRVQLYRKKDRGIQHVTYLMGFSKLLVEPVLGKKAKSQNLLRVTRAWDRAEHNRLRPEGTWNVKKWYLLKAKFIMFLLLHDIFSGIQYFIHWNYICQIVGFFFKKYFSNKCVGCFYVYNFLTLKIFLVHKCTYLS